MSEEQIHKLQYATTFSKISEIKIPWPAKFKNCNNEMILDRFKFNFVKNIKKHKNVNAIIVIFNFIFSRMRYF